MSICSGCLSVLTLNAWESILPPVSKLIVNVFLMNKPTIKVVEETESQCVEVFQLP